MYDIFGLSSKKKKKNVTKKLTCHLLNRALEQDTLGRRATKVFIREGKM